MRSDHDKVDSRGGGARHGGGTVLGAIAGGHPDGLMAGKGLTHGVGVGGPGAMRVLADDGVINSRD